MIRLINVAFDTFVDVSATKCLFKDDTLHPEDIKHWVEIDVLVITDPKEASILEITTEDSTRVQFDVFTNNEIIARIQTLTAYESPLIVLMTLYVLEPRISGKAHSRSEENPPPRSSL